MMIIQNVMVSYDQLWPYFYIVDAKFPEGKPGIIIGTVKKIPQKDNPFRLIVFHEECDPIKIRCVN